MINNISTSQSDLITALSHASNNANHTLINELQTIAPDMAQELLGQFGEEKVEQLLQQQLATIVTISSAPSKLQNYQLSNEELALRTVITSQQEGLLKNENSSMLMERLNNSVKDIHAAYANTSDILSSLGQLGHEQKSFLASSQQRVERSLNPFIDLHKSYLNNKDEDNFGFEISVKTKEGDVVTVTFNSSQNYDEAKGENVDGFSLSYEVDGDLSEAEHTALTQVLSGVGEMADEFFNAKKGTVVSYANPTDSGFDLGFLSDVNHQQLADFDVSFATSGGVFQQASTLDLSYQFDHEAKQQTFDFDSTYGNQIIDFSVSMSALGGKDVEQMQQYLAILDENLEDNIENSKGVENYTARGKQGDERMRQAFDFFKDAFTSMSSAAERYSNIETIAEKEFVNGRDMTADLVSNMIANDTRYKGLSGDTENKLGDGISKLADFDTKFSFYNKQISNEVTPKTVVELSQVTEQSKSGNLTGVEQKKTVSNHFDYQYTRPDIYDKKESYNVGAALKEGVLVGLDQHHDVNVEQEAYAFDPKENRWRLMLERAENTTQSSKVRVVKEIWSEEQENSKDINNKKRVGFEGTSEDFEKTEHHSHNKLITLIGDLDKLATDNKFKRQYLTELSDVNFFMDKKV